MNVKSVIIEKTQTAISNGSKGLEKLPKEVEGKESKMENSYFTNQENNIEEKRKIIIDAIEKASGKIEIESKGLQFSIHDKTNQIMIKVIDQNTNEVIKEVPSEKILDMMAKMVELSGSFVDERR